MDDCRKVCDLRSGIESYQDNGSVPVKTLYD